MVKLTWTPQALHDVEVICDLIAEDSGQYARFFANKVFSIAERIEEFPESGRIVPEVDQPNIREVILGNYRIIYRLLEAEIQILTVYHSARLLRLDQLKEEL
ncbi:MAG: type II toxin-antitoxin system RelE/ParE family toxin [Candidatus Omnitrophica bacterium]|nr:type II toxin-antitoxin system RelE/ParE family toxin [Candidatus Omnitrophota bacterium]